jgi:hypothetical protein
MTIITKTKINEDHRQGNCQCVELKSTGGMGIINNEHHQTGIAMKPT